MRFKKWFNLQEVGTTTADIAGFSRIAIPLVRRWWAIGIEDDEQNSKPKKKKKYKVPQIDEWNTFSEGNGYKYSCAMFVFPEIDSKKILSWSHKHIPEDVLCTDGEKGWEDEIHVTILYGLHTNEADDLKDILSKFKSSTITLGEVSKFEAEDYDVLKISVDGVTLRRMNKALKELPYTSKFDSYRPHCTLAYVKKGSCDDLLGNKYFDGWKIQMDSVTFSPSEGEKATLPLTTSKN